MDSTSEITHHTAAVNGVDLHYLKAGRGDAIVLLHGWPQTSHEWHKIMPRLADRYTTIAPDMRGLGDSSIPATGYDKRTVAEDIHQLIRQLEYRQIYLRKLVILDVPPPTASAAINLWHIGFHLVPELPEALIRGREEIYLRYFYRDAYPDRITTEDLKEYVRCYGNPASFKASLEYYRAFPQDVRDNLEFAKTPLKMPVLVLHGEQSPLGNSAFEVMKTLATDVRGDTIANCGHWIAEEQPEVLLDRLLDFFT
jgi:pimeloyl-ACP methyl ester carboxylesterase